MNLEQELNYFEGLPEVCTPTPMPMVKPPKADPNIRAIERPSATAILRRAADLIDERAHERDRPGGERSMAATVAAFNAIYGADLSETQGWVFMALLKMARSAGGAYKADDYEDLTAYSALAAESAAIENT